MNVFMNIELRENCNVFQQRVKIYRATKFYTILYIMNNVLFFTYSHISVVWRKLCKGKQKKKKL